MSPLRYQKWLRLNEVRRPMLNEHYDVTTAAYAVGYERNRVCVAWLRTPEQFTNVNLIINEEWFVFGAL